MTTSQQIGSICQQYNALLIEETDQALRIASSKPPAEQMLSALSFICDKPIQLETWPVQRIALWQALYALSASKEVSGNSLAELLNEVLSTAIQQRASDIHFEPGQTTYRIRLRIDGVLHAQPLLPGSIAAQLTARLKVLASLDIAEKRLPQDGQMDYQDGEHQASFRVSTLPCRYGEKLVLRLQQQTSHCFDIDTLGMPAEESLRFHRALASPQGLILITGPTGSGKTLSLYSALTRLNQVHRNICTVEDPIEIPLSGLNQTQLHTKAGLTYSTLLRALLRQDPDVIMIGEIRDSETADIAIKASQTGHLVLSTLHTHSTIGTLMRLEQLNIPRDVLTSSLRLIVTQRLVRKLCLHCRQPPQNSPEQPLSAAYWQATGCNHCYSGYYGRTALFEVLPVSETLGGLINQGQNATELEDIARQSGMTTLFENGCRAAAQGITSLDEVYRVLGHHDG
ncbi:type II secretion system protein GspE [Klebsiella sp. BIGb0407]|uniref:type II secretion system protein GspE n=1 Tax=Klebsiella sp. BIGb0407 TaxID=2940603 RepID=UPI00216A7BE4|nr:type II secretion system protein GspE [Klebsiella sp. BIGb0407]MCS3433106.1 protein transport protein HofB [Klebsiella sp. BIGb0407]